MARRSPLSIWPILQSKTSSASLESEAALTPWRKYDLLPSPLHPPLCFVQPFLFKLYFPSLFVTDTSWAQGWGEGHFVATIFHCHSLLLFSVELDVRGCCTVPGGWSQPVGGHKDPWFLGRRRVLTRCFGQVPSLAPWILPPEIPPVLSIGYGIPLGFLSQAEVHGTAVRLQSSCCVPPLRCCSWIPAVDEVRGLGTAWTRYQLAKYLRTLWDEGLQAEQGCCSGDVHWFIAISWNVMGFSAVDQSPCGYLFCQSDSLCERSCGRHGVHSRMLWLTGRGTSGVNFSC